MGPAPLLNIILRGSTGFAGDALPDFVEVCRTMAHVRVWKSLNNSLENRRYLLKQFSIALFVVEWGNQRLRRAVAFRDPIV